MLDGENLVRLNCTKCHALVPATALTKDVWKFHTLPAMGRYLGMTPYLDGYYKKDTSGLSLLEWQSIVSYYKKMAPDSLPASRPPVNPVNDWAGFVLKTPAPVDKDVFTTLAAISPYTHKIYTADAISGRLCEWDNNLKPFRSMVLPSTAVSASFNKDNSGALSAVFSCIGELEPMDFPNGRVINVNLDGKQLNPVAFATELARPVCTVSGDFNKDGLMDWIICGEGKLRGGVYLFKQNPGHTYTQVNITDQPGAIKAITGDFNKDGWPDLMVLFGRGDEGLTLFLNDQHGGFIKRSLLRFPPVYGSTDFQLADIDHDGNPDLIYTCGYNFNDSRILKPYHGLYIFKNTGDWHFKQQWFYPVNGCTKVLAADFKGDGNLDMVTSAFFADMLHNPAESFIYFEHDKLFTFKPHTIPVSKYGRWMSLGVGDYNNDGKPDIILGNYSRGFMFQPGLRPFWSKNMPFILLENHTKK
ncbi:MAG: FG-GAP repeat domain-containing protein [Mucilaginibacter sp.]